MAMKKAGREAMILREGFATGVRHMPPFGATGNTLLFDLSGYTGSHFLRNYSTNSLCSVLTQSSVCLLTIREIFCH